MQKIPLNLAAPGMVLARPIKNDQGIVLVGPGTELTAALLTRLEQMEVRSAVVEGHPVDLPGEGPRTPEEARAVFDERFSLVGDDPVMARLKAHLLERALSALD